MTPCLRSCQLYVSNKQQFTKEESDWGCSVSLTNVPQLFPVCFKNFTKLLWHSWGGRVCPMDRYLPNAETIHLLLLKADTLWMSRENHRCGPSHGELNWYWKSNPQDIFLTWLVWCNFRGVTWALLFSKCQHKAVGKISAFEWEQHVQIFCASLFAVQC